MRLISEKMRMIGIVILNYINYSVTERCVESIFATYTKPLRVVIVDNGSPNDSVAHLKKIYGVDDRVEIITIPRNIGYAAGNNVGIKRCKELKLAECILTNSDIIFKMHAIENLISSLRSLNDAVIVGPKILRPDGALNPSSTLSPARVIDVLEIGRFFPVKRLDENEATSATEVYTVSGCCFAININRFLSINAFDEKTFLYNEENILGIQVRQSDFSSWFDPTAIVIHAHGASSGKRNTFTCKEYIRSTIYYWKHYRKANNWFLRTIICAYILKLIIIRKREGIELNLQEIREAGRSEL